MNCYVFETNYLPKYMIRNQKVFIDDPGWLFLSLMIRISYEQLGSENAIISIFAQKVIKKLTSRAVVLKLTIRTRKD